MNTIDRECGSPDPHEEHRWFGIHTSLDDQYRCSGMGSTACRAYYGPGDLVCGLMEHKGDHVAAAWWAGRMRRFPFPREWASSRAPAEWGYPR